MEYIVNKCILLYNQLPLSKEGDYMQSNVTLFLALWTIYLILKLFN